jgi:hypothetical protein
VRRTLVGFSDRDLSELDAPAALKQVPRAELIRQAVGAYLEIDGLAYQKKLRDEW